MPQSFLILRLLICSGVGLSSSLLVPRPKVFFKDVFIVRTQDYYFAHTCCLILEQCSQLYIITELLDGGVVHSMHGALMQNFIIATLFFAFILSYII